MMTYLRTLTRAQRITAAALLAAVLSVAALLLLTRSGSHPTAARSQPTIHPVTSPTHSPSPSHVPVTTKAPGPALAALPKTTSADVYAREVASALWNIDYRSTTRAEIEARWQGELATTVPIGTPAGTTIAQAQSAAMSTLNTYLPSAAMWASLARDHTSSMFTVTAISEPSSWVSAVASGHIADPGLTARAVVGVQRISYGVGTARRTSSQSQQLTVAMLCPPTTTACRLEIIPPTDTTGTTG